MKSPPGATFSPTTATLIKGEHDSVLIDTLIATEDVDKLADYIEQEGTSLRAILITHGHPDHYFGADRLAARFPGVRVAAASGVADYIRKNRTAELALFEQLMDFEFVKPSLYPQVLASDVLELEGEELHIVNVGQGDIAPSTVIWIPSLDTVVAGDVAYNSMHLMLGLTGVEEWRRWIESVKAIRALNPTTVIAGHKKPGADNDAERVLRETEAYIRDFSEISARASSAQEIIANMTERYPNYPNLTILQMSAAAVMSVSG